MLRWEGLARPLSDDAAPRARVVAFDALHEALPADMPRFDAEARAAQRRARNLALQARETR
jgi:hypothetical protein